VVYSTLHASILGVVYEEVGANALCAGIPELDSKYVVGYGIASDQIVLGIVEKDAATHVDVCRVAHKGVLVGFEQLDAAIAIVADRVVSEDVLVGAVY